ncbi:MAG: ABC-F family ATP-binding cassette domain-containing protein [Treponema sp.]|jgi:ATP-binding cassette subfamily F protein 3|nr:ABC-F family ATP-binding cassette domain-containing protein [Treponema sp.]
MAFVQFSQISLAFGDRDILKDVSLHLAPGSRAALAGANGSGKSTLMKVLAGKLAADSGDRALQKGTRVSYLPQSGIVHEGKTLREEAETAFGPIHDMITAMDGIGRELEKTKADGGKTAVLLEEYHRLGEAVENSGYYRREAAISMVLSGLGFAGTDLERDTGEFSGGWQMRIALAKVLLESPDILLLDEPTNYLDIEARAWLEDWIKGFPGGCLLVSHDRYFLDVTVNEVYELFQGKLKRYAGNYSSYERIREAELESLLRRYAEQQEEIAKTEALINRFRYKASKAAFAQELIKRLEKIERIEIPENLKKISISFPPPPHSGRVVLTLSGIGKRYGERKVLAGLDLSLDAGERLVVAGRNGAGKTTLLRIVAGGDADYDGAVSFGSGIVPGYFSQDAAEAMQGTGQVIDFIEQETPTHLIPKLRDMLGAFLFRGDDIYKSISVLSGGEKSRLALLKMLLTPVNLLILDEPTNHLDLHSKDILLDTLRRFSGTIIFVSHDRSFMEALSTKVLELASPAAGAPAAARFFYGNYAYYLERLNSGDSVLPGGNNTPIQKQPLPNTRFEDEPPPRSHQADSASVLSSLLVKQNERRVLTAGEKREIQKQKQAAVRKLKKREAELLSALEHLESEKRRLETELSKPEVYSSGEKAKSVQKQLGFVNTGIEEKTSLWEKIAEELEKERTEHYSRTF